MHSVIQFQWTEQNSRTMNYHAGMYKLQGSAIYILCKTSQFDSWTEKFEEVYHRLYFGVSQTLVGDA